MAKIDTIIQERSRILESVPEMPFMTFCSSKNKCVKVRDSKELVIQNFQGHHNETITLDYLEVGELKRFLNEYY